MVMSEKPQQILKYYRLSPSIQVMVAILTLPESYYLIVDDTENQVKDIIDKYTKPVIFSKQYSELIFMCA